MKIIDAHLHFSNINSFKETAESLSHVEYSSSGILSEYEQSNVVLGIGMGVTEVNEGFPDREGETPMGLDLESTVPSKILCCPGINPYKLEKDNLKKLDVTLSKPESVGIKIYLGYYPFYAYDDVYKPVYEMAEKHQLPVVFHTGDTYSERGLLKYSHPLTVDEVAVFNRNITFMMAHLGDPWVLDGAEVLYKNPNVYADLSGLIVGTRSDISRYDNSERFFDHLRHALAFTDNYKKFLFGTDWPLVPVKPYIEFVKGLIPQEYHEDVFYNTALKVFPKLKKFL
ncbi:amidohydrolase family protein [Pseudalkalibacillus caeni]|uniref:Amidohydrolase n=1 Tax=Exobacillus caeni TaxID=2574798 RepID=A0A5R9F4W1_9BACL|nr:amidohydrolase family protein [Pseudalkalibacillus caeni]TLS37529.1 amidohydrolase [Pseudalkalibacillus caeni]